MRYKAVSLAIIVLLISTPTYAQQKKSYIVVETPRTTESTAVITGQPLAQIYVVRFIDLTDSGEKIIVQEEFLYDLKVLGDFEVLDFYIDKQTKRREFLEHIWYLHFTLRIVNPKKGAYVIPSIEIPWKHKKAGQKENDPSILTNYDFKTDEVHINYVTTIPEKESYLEIRDEINFGNFENQAWIWRIVTWFLRAVPVMLLLIVLLALKRSSRKEPKIDDMGIADRAGIGEKTRDRSRFGAWLNLRASIRRLKSCQTGSPGQISDCLKAEGEIVSAIKDYLRIQIPQLSVGSTPLTIAEHISKNIDQYSTKKDALLQLARKAVVYQADVEKSKDSYFRNPLAEVKELRLILSQLRLYRRAAPFTQNSFFKARSRLKETWLTEVLHKIGRRR